MVAKLFGSVQVGDEVLLSSRRDRRRDRSAFRPVRSVEVSPAGVRRLVFDDWSSGAPCWLECMPGELVEVWS